jgi:hypothetical protein
MALEFPYKRQSPISKKMTVYRDLEQVWQEIYQLVDNWKDSDYSLGRNLYFYLPLFMNPKWIISGDESTLITEYNYVKEFNIPLGRDLDSADAEKLEVFDRIRSEINNIKIYMSEKNGR